MLNTFTWIYSLNQLIINIIEIKEENEKEDEESNEGKKVDEKNEENDREDDKETKGKEKEDEKKEEENGVKEHVQTEENLPTSHLDLEYGELLNLVRFPSMYKHTLFTFL